MNPAVAEHDSTLQPQAFGPLPLHGSDVHVWCMPCQEPLPDHRLERIRNVLLPHERAREATFRFARDRQSYLLTRALVRNVLGACTGIAPWDLHLQANAHGKPELADDSRTGERIAFNVSHATGLIALAVMRRGAIGIDVEKICDRTASLEIAQRFFAPEEVAVLRDAPATEVPTLFFRYWTLKEAYVKARGVGLSAGLDAFAFGLDATAGAIALRTAPEDRASDWKLWQLASGPYQLAVCAERVPGCRQRLFVRTVDPDWRCTTANMDLIGESDLE